MSERLRYSVQVPASWSGPEQRELPTHLEELFRGDAPAEGLLVQFMEGADPDADLAGWAEAPIHLTGAPAVSLALTGAAPETLEWRREDVPAALVERLAVDEAHLFAGQTQDASVHTLLARRGTLAWNLGLSLPAAGADERAAATFATLALG